METCYGSPLGMGTGVVGRQRENKQMLQYSSGNVKEIMKIQRHFIVMMLLLCIQKESVSNFCWITIRNHQWYIFITYIPATTGRIFCGIYLFCVLCEGHKCAKPTVSKLRRHTVTYTSYNIHLTDSFQHTLGCTGLPIHQQNSYQLVEEVQESITHVECDPSSDRSVL